ncbi:MAG: hypothetical protein ABIJ27_03155 [Candidatus Omnitrophota bacterium]
MIKKAVFVCAICSVVWAANGHAGSFRYDSNGKRDPFVPLVGMNEMTSAGRLKLDEVVAIDEITLEGVARGAGGRATAFLNGELVRENQRRGNVEIKKISDKDVTVTINGKEHRISVRKPGPNP